MWFSLPACHLYWGTYIISFSANSKCKAIRGQTMRNSLWCVCVIWGVIFTPVDTVTVLQFVCCFFPLCTVLCTINIFFVVATLMRIIDVYLQPSLRPSLFSLLFAPHHRIVIQLSLLHFNLTLFYRHSTDSHVTNQ